MKKMWIPLIILILTMLACNLAVGDLLGDEPDSADLYDEANSEALTATLYALETLIAEATKQAQPDGGEIASENTLAITNYTTSATCSFEQSGHFIRRTCSVLINVDLDYQLSEPPKYISCSAGSAYASELVEANAGVLSLEFPGRDISDTFDDEGQDGAIDSPGINTFGKDVTGAYTPVECYASLSAGNPTTAVQTLNCLPPEDPLYDPACTAPYVELSP